MRRRAGFTFMEILFVIVIIMALAAIGFPRMKGSYFKARIKGSGRDVAGFLRYAQISATLRELPTEVRFSPDTDQYELVLLDEFGQRIEEKRERHRRRRKDNTPTQYTLGDDVSGVRRLPDGVHFSAIYSAAPLTADTDVPRIIYYPDGSATPDTIVVQDDHDNALNVEIYRTSGLARVEKGLPREEPKQRTLYYGPKHKRR